MYLDPGNEVGAVLTSTNDCVSTILSFGLVGTCLPFVNFTVKTLDYRYITILEQGIIELKKFKKLWVILS